MVERLLAAGANPNAAHANGLTPLMTAARTGTDGTHPLAYAVIVGQSAFAHFLLEQGADPDGAIDGIAALHAPPAPSIRD